MKKSTTDNRVLFFGRRVRECREYLGMTADDLAKRSGLTPAAISMIENGNREPLLSTAIALSEGLQMKFWKLLGEKFE